MRFHQKLEKKIKLKNLPRSYNIVGKILVLKLRPELYKYRKKIGKAVLEIVPNVHTVILDKGIKEKTRKPKIEIIAGCKETETLHKEYGCRFLTDLSEIMWSKGNKAEKQRLVRLVKKNDVIVDMFSGIGYWTIFLGRKAKKIYAIDVNPKAVEYLRKNVWLNKIEEKVEILEGDCRKFSKLLEGEADKVIMGYIFDTQKFLPSALKIVKNNGIIYFHSLVKRGEVEKLKQKIKKLGEKNGFEIRIPYTGKVKSYAPSVDHVVFDLKVVRKRKDI